MATVQERTVSVWDNQINARVKVAGSGPALVFLHSGFGPMWGEFHDAAARDFTVYAPEHPGTSAGNPEALAALDDMWDLVLFYDELLDKLGLEKPALAGHSFGGMVAADIAANFPNRVGKLILIDSLGLWRDDIPVKNYQVMPAAQLTPMLFSNTSHPAIPKFFAQPDDPESIIRVTWALGCSGKFSWPLPDKGLKKRIHRIASPTLILWGKQDGLTPPAYADEFAKRISGSKVEMVDKAAHMVPVEQPETTAKLISGFAKG